jgi:acyl-CoA thioester hydrolase
VDLLMSITRRIHETSIRVRYAETDAMGLAYNSHYLTWFEVGRTELLREIGFTYRDTEENGYRLPLREAGITYIKPAHYDDVLKIRTCLGAKPGARVRILYEIVREESVIATGFTEHVFTDSSLTPVRPPSELRESLACFWSDSAE